MTLEECSTVCVEVYPSAMKENSEKPTYTTDEGKGKFAFSSAEEVRAFTEGADHPMQKRGVWRSSLTGISSDAAVASKL